MIARVGDLNKDGYQGNIHLNSMIVWSALIIRILVVTTYVIDEDQLETLWKCCKRHHLYDGRQFLARKFEISRL